MSFGTAPGSPNTGGFRSVHVVINPLAGRPQPVLAQMATAWQDVGLAWEVSVTQGSGDATELARRAVDAGVGAVAVYGGDGTAMEVAIGMMGSGIPLLVLPGGTANAFAATLGIPGDVEAACRLLTAPAPATRLVDVGQVGDKYFLLRLGIGLEARVTVATTPEMKDRLGIAAYSVTAASMLGTAEIVRYHLRLDGQWQECEGVNCMVTNSGHLGLGGLTVTPDSAQDDGLLEVVVLRDTSPLTLVGVSATLLRRGEHPALACWRAQEVIVEADPPQEVVCDGEPLGHTPVSARVLPRVLQVIVPPDVSDAT